MANYKIKSRVIRGFERLILNVSVTKPGNALKRQYELEIDPG